MTEETISLETGFQPLVKCPKHGEHPYILRSNIPEHEGIWCAICWLESLGEPLARGISHD